MVDVILEREHLAEAERHLSESKERVASLQAFRESMREKGLDTSDVSALIETMLDILATMQAHRDTLDRTVQQLLGSDRNGSRPPYFVGPG